jgi:hypothetical protein
VVVHSKKKKNKRWCFLWVVRNLQLQVEGGTHELLWFTVSLALLSIIEAYSAVRTGIPHHSSEHSTTLASPE